MRIIARRCVRGNVSRHTDPRTGPAKAIDGDTIAAAGKLVFHL